MTYGEAKKILPPRYAWLPWHTMSRFRTVLLAALGISMGFFLGQHFDKSPQPAVKTNSLLAVIHDGYVVLVIDRTRTNWCNVIPTRVAFKPAFINGISMPMILPLPAQPLAWPFLGRQVFGLMVVREKDLAPGEWTIMTTRRSMCNWYDYFSGPEISIGQVKITIPDLQNESQVH